MCNVLLGGAVGDALGVPFESMLVNNQALINWDGDSYIGSPYHQLQAGQWSDDTQMSLMVANSLIDCQGFDPDDLSKRYVEWMFSGKARGYGKTTLMALTNIKNGKHWSESGVAGSFGNGTAMRAAPFGVYFRNDLQSLVNIMKIDSAITHASEEAEAGSIAIALAAAYAVNNDTENLLEKIHEKLPNSKIKGSIFSASALLNNDITPEQALRVTGTSANVKETVPAALYCFLKFNNYRDAVVAAIRAGKDTDTTACIVGALFATKLGRKSIPVSWVEGVEDKEKLIELDNKLYNRSGESFFPRR
jgi:ADP-ribosyl-[dinitrogen reductase] hydrolase